MNGESYIGGLNAAGGTIAGGIGNMGNPALMFTGGVGIGGTTSLCQSFLWGARLGVVVVANVAIVVCA